MPRCWGVAPLDSGGPERWGIAATAHRRAEPKMISEKALDTEVSVGVYCSRKGNNDLKMPRVIKRSKVFSLLLLSVAVTYGNLPSLYAFSSQKAAESRTWEPNKALLNRLDSPQDIEEFQLNPPRNYTPHTRLGDYGSKATAWAGPLRRDGTRPQVMVLTVTLPAEEVKQYTLEQILYTFMERLSHRRQDWTRTSAEKGTINGLTFVRARWSGTDPNLGRKMHGFNYVTMVGDKVIQLSSQDVEPYAKESLDLAEASALTFKKR